MVNNLNRFSPAIVIVSQPLLDIILKTVLFVYQKEQKYFVP